MGYEHGGVVEQGLSAVRHALTRVRGRRRRRPWVDAILQLAVLPLVGAVVLVVALSGPLFIFSLGAAIVGMIALVAPSAVSFALARRGGREPAAVMAWGTLALQLALTGVLSVLL